MWRHYLSTAMRGFVRHRLYSLINIVGLAVGLACVVLIALFIRYETSYDTWVPDSSRLYRVEITGDIPGRSPINIALVSFPLTQAMQEQIPGVTAQTRLRRESMTLTVNNRQFLEHVDVVDPNFFKVIRLPLVTGNPDGVFGLPESMVLSQTAARKFFGDVNPMGRTITVFRRLCQSASNTCKETAIAMTVTGVMHNLPGNSQLAGNVFMPDTSVADRASWAEKHQWLSLNYYGYVALAPGVRPQTVLAALAPILDREMGPELSDSGLHGKASQFIKVDLTPFVDVHLASFGYDSNMTPAESRITIYGVAAVGLLILLVACFNFMNLATARAALRAREISLRKCVGASRRQLIVQFLSESVLMSLFALVLALAAVEILLPAYDGLLGLPLGLHVLGDWRLSLVILAVAIAAGLVSGSYPALVLSGFRPAAVLRTLDGPAGSGRLRAVLVVLQFALSIGLSIAAIVIGRQISFARDIDLGFHRHNIVVMRQTVGADRWQGFAEALRQDPGVISAAASSTVPFQQDHDLGVAQVPGQPDTITLNRIMISPEFPRVYGIPLLAGRLLEANRAKDTLSTNAVPSNEGHDILINEAAAAKFGYTPREAVGKTIVYNRAHVHIVGVLADTRFLGALQPVEPTVYFWAPDSTQLVSVRITGRNIPATLAAIDATLRSFSPTMSASPHFLSGGFEKLYQADEQEGTMFRFFVGFAIFLACLGFFGLAVFTAQRRTKEIGMRKVAGARTLDIVRLMLWRMSMPVLVANIVAWPAAYYCLQRWLQGFADHIWLNPGYFVGGGVIALLIAWATVFLHTLRLARTSPVHALRYE